MRTLLGTILFSACLWCVPALGAAPDSKAQAKLPAAAQKAMKRGLSAAKQKEWQLAIRYFSEARKLAPQTPRVLYYLALAHDNAGGQELVAIAWFRAYLTVASKSPVAAKVRERIIDLEIKAEGSALKLLHMAVRGARALPDNWARSYEMGSVPKIMARMGDVTGAKAVAEEAKSSQAWQDIAVEQAKAGDWDGAGRTIYKVKEGVYRSATRREFVKIKAEAGDIRGAQKFLSSITWDSAKTNAFLYIARAQLKKGDKMAALASLSLCTAVADTMKSSHTRGTRYYEAIKIQAPAGDIAGALKLAARIPDKTWRSWAYREIAQTQVKLGNLVGARSTMQLASSGDQSGIADKIAQRYRDMGRKKLKDGDIAGALELAALSPKCYAQTSLYNYIVTEQIKTGDLAAAARTSDLMTESRYGGYKAASYRKLTEAYLKNKNPASAARTLRKAEELVPKADKTDMAQNYVKCGKLWLEMKNRRETQRSLERAKTAAHDIKKNHWKRKYAFRYIAELQIKLGDLAGALKSTEEVEANYNRWSLYREIAQAHARAGRFATAEGLAARIIDLSYQFRAYELIVGEQVKVGKIEAALKTAARITDESARGNAYAKVIEAQIRNEDITAASRTAALIPKQDKRSSSLKQICSRQIETGDLAGARKTALSIPVEKTRMAKLKDVAGAQAAEQDFAGAEKTAALISDPVLRSWAQDSIAGAYAGTHDFLGATNTAKTIADPGWRSSAWTTISAHLYGLGDRQGAKKASDEAASSARKVSADLDRWKKLNSLARSYYLGGDLALQRKLLAEAAGALRRVDSAQAAGGQYGVLADKWLALNDRMQAEETLELKLCAIPRMRKYWKSGALAGVAQTMVKAGNLTGALAVITLMPERDRPSALVKVAAALAELGEVERARDIAAGGSPGLQTSIHLSVAKVQLKAKDKSGALESAGLARKAGVEKPEKKDAADKLLKTLSEIQAQAGDIAAALQDIKRISGAKIRLEAIKSVVGHLIEAKDTRKARRLLAEAVGLVPEFESRSSQMSHYTGLADLYKKAQDRRGAAKVAVLASRVIEKMKREGDSSLKYYHHNLVQIQLAADNFSRAQKIMSNIRDPHYRNQARKNILEALARKGDLPAALKLVRSIRSKSSRDSALFTVAWSLLNANHLKETLKLAESLKWSNRLGVLQQVAYRQVKAGDLEAAAKTYAMVEKPAGCAQLNDPVSLIRTNLAYHLFSTEKHTEALKIASSIPDQEMRNRAIGWILAGRAAAADKAGMLEAAALLPKNDLRISMAGANFVEAQLKRGEVKAAEKAASEIKDLTCRTSALLAVVFKKIRAGDLKGAEVLAAMMPATDSRIRVLLAVAEGHLVAGQKDTACKMLESIIEKAGKLDSEYARARWLTAAARLQLRAGSEAIARETLKSAAQAAGKVVDERSRTWAKRIVAGDFGAPAPKQNGTGTPSTTSRSRRPTKPPTNKELSAWVRFISYNLKSGIYRDLPGFLQSIKGKKPKDMVRAMVGGGRSLVDAMKRMQKIELEWAAKRKKAKAATN
jgi:hypothetical protein